MKVCVKCGVKISNKTIYHHKCDDCSQKLGLPVARTSFSSYPYWSDLAKRLGWVHAHDSFVVLDDVESGFCIGEFDSETGTGWIYSQYLD